MEDLKIFYTFANHIVFQMTDFERETLLQKIAEANMRLDAANKQLFEAKAKLDEYEAKAHEALGQYEP